MIEIIQIRFSDENSTKLEISKDLENPYIAEGPIKQLQRILKNSLN